MSMMRELLMARQQKPTQRYWLDANQSNPEMAASDAAAIAVFKANGLCEHDDYMTYEEANAVTQLPSFIGVTNLRTWDWSALSNMHNTSLFRTFYQCKNLCFTELPENFGSVATNMQETFYRCTNLALTSLPDGFGSVATNMQSTFYQCTNLALTSLPDGFGSVATNIQETFYQCTNLALTSLPDGFGSVATSMRALSCNNFAWNVERYPAHFASKTTTLEMAFTACYRYNNSHSIIYITGDDFGQKSKSFKRLFWECTYLKRIEGGTINLSGLDSDSGLDRFSNYGIGLLHVCFSGDMKYCINNNNAYLQNIDNESLFSIATTLHDWRDENGFPVGNDGKIWTVTSAQKAILDTEMYDATRTYTQYVEDKGWTVTTA